MDIYLEGGPHLRRPMTDFIRRAVERPAAAFAVIARGPRERTIAAFSKAPSDALLLVDSEGDDLVELASRVMRRGRAADSASRSFFMVQLMETWFLADRALLARYFGAGFRANALSGNPDLETIRKQDVLNDLHNATRHSRKGAYHKSKHSAGLLEQIDPAAVYSACPNFARLVDFLRGSATRG